MYCFIFGFQRFVWCPKWTPASSRSFNAIPFNCPPMLAFAELEALARALLSVLLPLLDARVARQEPFLLQLRPQLDVVFDDLAGDADAGDGREHVEFIGRFGHGQRPLDLGAERLGGEGLLEGLAVDRQNPGAGSQEHAGGRRLAPAGPVILDSCCHDLCDLAPVADLPVLRLLALVRVLVARVYLQL